MAGLAAQRRPQAIALPSPWITSAGLDLVLFVATPLLILPLIILTLRYAGPSQLPEVQFNLGITLESRGDPEGAVAAYRKSLSLRPMDPETHLRASINLTSSLIKLAQRKIAAGSPRLAAWRRTAGTGRQPSITFAGPRLLPRRSRRRPLRREGRGGRFRGTPRVCPLTRPGVLQL